MVFMHIAELVHESARTQTRAKHTPRYDALRRNEIAGRSAPMSFIWKWQAGLMNAERSDSHSHAEHVSEILVAIRHIKQRVPSFYGMTTGMRA